MLRISLPAATKNGRGSTCSGFFRVLNLKGVSIRRNDMLFVFKKWRIFCRIRGSAYSGLSNIALNEDNVHEISQAGRLRWKIENEGFNNQKNNGYNAEHKFSRTNFNATKNYYQLMQIADIINQLTYKIIAIQGFIKNLGLTVNALIKDILSYLKAMEFDDFALIEDIFAKNVQLRY